MNRDLAELLVDEFLKQLVERKLPFIPPTFDADEFFKQLAEQKEHDSPFMPKRTPLLEALLKTEVVGSKHFFQTVPKNMWRYPEDVRNPKEIPSIHTITIRRVMVNRRAKKYVSSAAAYLRKIEDYCAHDWFYDSSIMCMRLTTWPQLVKLMMDCEHPFSVFAKYKRYNLVNGTTSSKTEIPLFVIPGGYDPNFVGSWELVNTR